MLRLDHAISMLATLIEFGGGLLVASRRLRPVKEL